MGLFERLERGLERAVNGAFAKAFKSSVQPVEIASAMRRAMDDRAAATSRITGKTGSKATVPNFFTVELSTSDYDDLTAYADDLTDELLASAEEHIDSQRYRTAGPMRIVFVENTELETGVFTVRPASARRPFDLTPAGLSDPSTHAAQGYEEFEELSMGMPVAKEKAKGKDKAEPEVDDSEQAGQAGQAGEDDAKSAPPWAPKAATPAAADDADAADEDEDDVPDEMAAAAAAARAAAPTPRPAPPVAAAPAPPQAPPAPAKRPAPVRRPWLEIDGDRYPLLGAITVVGRDHTADIVLDDPGISRRHAEVRVTFDGPHPVVTLIDLQSTNGVFVNGERIDQCHVSDGDRLTLGRSSMTLRTGGR